MENRSLAPGALYVVGTPIGNLEDMTLRAIRILKEVDAIAAEDTRHTGKLLQHFQIATPQISYHEHNRHSRQPELIARLQQQQAIALVSDAGMPGISDPGCELIAACIAENIDVVPIPGVTAAITALVASGLSADRFYFEGFLPAKSKARRDRLCQLEQAPHTLIFYESPYRLRETLEDLADCLGKDRAIAVTRELTKLHESFWRGTLEGAIAHYKLHEPKGEFTLVLAGKSPSELLHLSEADLKEELQALIDGGLTRSQASRRLAEATSFSRRYLYHLTLKP